MTDVPGEHSERMSANPYQPPTAFDPTRGYCRQHVTSPAVALCHSCKAPVCATCDFQFPGGLHFCPACATKTTAPLSSTRKTMLGWSIVAAVWVTVALVVLFSGTLAEAAENEPGATIIGSLIMIPALIGLALSIGSMDRRAGNPPLVWIAVIWNVVLTVGWLVLCVIGLMMPD